MGDQTTPNGSVNGNGPGVPSSPLTTTPFPASRKIYVDGTQPGVRVPMREISLTPTKAMNGSGSMINTPQSMQRSTGKSPILREPKWIGAR